MKVKSLFVGILLVIFLVINPDINNAGNCPWLTVIAPTTGKITNTYANTNQNVKRNWYHTGIDYKGSGDVWAAADGIVVKVEYMNKRDHGMGNNIIIKHILSDCSAIYSTYSHLASIGSNIAENVYVSRGQKIGTKGGSGYGKQHYWSTHLHFEMKLSPVTGTPSGKLYWGYTKTHPDNYGYRNPNNYF